MKTTISGRAVGGRRICGGLAVLLCVGLAPAVWAANAQPTPIGSVDGHPITESELRAAAHDAFVKLDRDVRKQEHDVTEAELKRLMDERVIALEAAAQKTTPELLLASHAAAPVTAADIDQFYEANKARIPQPKEQVATRIQQYLEGQRRGEGREKLLVALRAKYHAEVLLEPVRVEVETTGFPVKGPAAAPVTIVEFSDFQCPFCSRVVPTLEQVMTHYNGKVRVVYREFPLPMHPNAAKAAEAALCANAQGKFWEMHDAMFKDQAGLAVDGLKAKAVTLGLDPAVFNKCLDSGSQLSAVESDLKAGRGLGVDSTPALFINGRYVSGAVPYDQLAPMIDEELKRKAQGSR